MTVTKKEAGAAKAASNVDQAKVDELQASINDLSGQLETAKADLEAKSAEADTSAAELETAKADLEVVKADLEKAEEKELKQIETREDVLAEIAKHQNALDGLKLKLKDFPAKPLNEATLHQSNAGARAERLRKFAAPKNVAKEAMQEAAKIDLAGS